MDFLTLPADYDSRRASALKGLPEGEEIEYADLEGPGCIRHLWITGPNHRPEMAGGPAFGRQAVLRIYCDDAAVPQVECPLEPFFGKHWQEPFEWTSPHFVPLRSRYLAIAPYNGYNSYFPMPFARRARLTLRYDACAPETQSPHAYVQVDWHAYGADALAEPLRFHARWRHENPCDHYGEHFLVADIDAPAYLVGLSGGVNIQDDADAWCHHGGDFAYLDGETEAPQHLHGIGLEDFFSASWGTLPFGAPFAGAPYFRDGLGGCLSFYRLFVEDTIRCRRSAHLMLGALANDVSATAYWYQAGSAPRYFDLSAAAARMPGAACPRGALDLPVWETGTWDLIGPFRSETEDQFRDGPTPDALNAEIGKPCAFGDYAREASPTTVRCLRRQARRHFVDFNAAFRPAVPGIALQTHTAAYARTTVRAPRAGKGRLVLACDDWAAAWLNGHNVLQAKHDRGFATAIADLALQRGANELVVKLANFDNNSWRAWAFCARVEDAQGRPLPYAPT